MTTEISRVKFITGDTAQLTEREKLADDSLKVLGYRKMAEAMTIPGALMATLRRLEIEPLVRREVNAYKRHKARPGMWGSHKRGILFTGLTVAFTASAEILNERTGWNTFSLHAVAVVVQVIIALVFVICAIGTLLEDPSGARILRNWETALLASWPGTVPEFALRKAVQIKQELPSVIFLVEYLTEMEVAVTRRDPDPFLVAKLGDECYYIDVWDERDFEREV